tara:strand:- start:992 stop:1843 length:852 start_codon:yes stop_codon:yes gene_type:complete
MAITITKPTIGGSEGTWGATINTALDTIVNAANGTSGTLAPNLTTVTINGVSSSVTAPELDLLSSLNTGGSVVQSFVIEDGDGTEVSVTDGKEIKFVEGHGIDINWTDTSDGTDADPYDLTFSLKTDMRINSNTDVYTGNSNDYIHYDTDVGMRFYTAGGEDMRLTDGGDLHVDGNITAFSTTVSDQRLKHDINKIENALDKVSQINGYTFTYNEDGRNSAGVIAQEIENVLPSAVESKKLVFSGQEGVEYKTVQYDQIHGLLIEAIKELKAEIEELKNDATE